ncbi:hypothetical protein [Hyphomicrobium sp.]|jgi:hypothetical protein|uniref:hypothetical protein n=1 Tax=Hyphomicrobium sp. TaxID=82 RepID=UPI0035630891
MDRDTEIKALMDEAENVRAWFSKYSDDLKGEPANAGFLRLQLMCRREYEKRCEKLAALGVIRPQIEE